MISYLEGRGRGGRVFAVIMGGTWFARTTIGFDEGFEVESGEGGGGGGGGCVIGGGLLKFRSKRA